MEDLNKQLGDRLAEMMRKIAENSGGSISLVADSSDTITLYLGDNVLGRSYSMYSFSARVGGWMGILPMILEEVLMPLRLVAPDSYNAAAPELQSMGSLVYNESSELHDWNGLFE